MMRRLLLAATLLSLVASGVEARHYRFHYYGGRWHDAGRYEWHSWTHRHATRLLLRPRHERREPIERPALAARPPHPTRAVPASLPYLASVPVAPDYRLRDAPLPLIEAEPAVTPERVEPAEPVAPAKSSRIWSWALSYCAAVLVALLHISWRHIMQTKARRKSPWQ